MNGQNGEPACFVTSPAQSAYPPRDERNLLTIHHSLLTFRRMPSDLTTFNDSLRSLRDQLALTRYADRPRLARELDRLYARRMSQAQAESGAESLRKSIEQSAQRVMRLRDLPLRQQFDPALPITAHVEEISKALADHQLIVVCGATGSGKTTQLPKICIAAGRGTFGLIGHTQPRRIAARSIADRLASELATTVGGGVGYQVRFNDRTGPDTRIKLMTDGILLRELKNDRLLRRYDTLIIDEAHERSLNIDFLLGVLQRLLPQRPELRVIITSATIDPQRFAEFFSGAPIIEVSGRSYPVEVRYRPLHGKTDDDEEADELTLPEGVVAAIHELDRTARGDTLVFLPGERQIRDVEEALSKARFHHTEVLPLYARLATRDQEKIFTRGGARRIVLATNVAETSLTVPGIKYVVDSGLARISRYSVRGKVQRLPIEPVSQASADQRKGRCGRESDGVCVRLYAEDEFSLRDAFTPPEILRTNLASVILQMATQELGEPEDFPFVDPPDTRQINDGYRLLQELKAVDDSRRVTSLGKQIAALPVDPRLARMLIAASHLGCVAEMLILTAFLASQDPRERPQDAQTQADQKHAAFADSRSDFITVLNLWRAYRERTEALSNSQFRKWCRENFLSYIRLREWQELHRQLSEASSELSLSVNAVPADYAQFHQAMLTGFLGSIGSLQEKREFTGARGTRFVVAPGTPLAAKPPQWIVAASLMETTRVYARMVAAVEPQWIEAAGAHLIKRTHSEPHWVEDRGFVAAHESISLYGLILSAQRRINYGQVEPRAAKEIFVREALVEGRSKLRAEFLDRNRALRREIERMESKIRRRDILVDDQTLCEFYLARLPDNVNSLSTFDKWLRGHAHETGHKRPHSRTDAPAHSTDARARNASLQMTSGDAMRREVPELTPQSHPDALQVGDNPLPLDYRFEPALADDGLTITVPEPLLRSLDAGRLAWLVPGWRIEKLTAVIRALPKQIRRSLVPAPDYAVRAASELNPDADFHVALAQWIQATSGESISADEIAALPLPEYLRMNIRVIDVNGNTIAEGRDLTQIRRTIRGRDGSTSSASQADRIFRSWEFDELPASRTVERRGLRFEVYPTLRDHGDGVELFEASSESEAQLLLRQAVLRLLMLALPEQYKYARKRFASARELVLLGQGMNLHRPLADAFAERAFVERFLPENVQLPRDGKQYVALLDSGRADFGEVVDRIEKLGTVALAEARAVRGKLAAIQGPAFATVTADVQRQLDELLPIDFPAGVSAAMWPHLPRYFKALNRRLDKLAGNLKRDAELMALIAPFTRVLTDVSKINHGAQPRPELERLRWMIEEYRVSLFAQDLRTAIPVSDKRLAEQAEKAKVEAQKG